MKRVTFSSDLDHSQWYIYENVIFMINEVVIDEKAWSAVLIIDT